MQSDITDYRNGKYQGPVNSNKQRHGFGIFIDDDLAFYISQWQFNKLNGPTLIYLTHGKYMYGEWKQNQPHGLNVFRSGDTVLISKFNQGLPSDKCLLIFERYNFACVLTEQNQEWQLCQSGPITSHKKLLEYISQIGLTVPDHYLSLTKFACSYTHQNPFIKTFPYLSNYCYFGFVNGLAIIFNSNNGVVSVGFHQNEKLCQFGGKFNGIRSAQQGNFESRGETVAYQGSRPQTKINSIFQNVHKKAINFHNQYFDSKFKVFDNVERMLREKLKEIAQEGVQKELISEQNINDSLDFHDYDEEQSMKNYENRQRMFSPPKKSIMKSRTQQQRSGASTRLITSQSYSRNSKANYRPSGSSKAREVESTYQEILETPKEISEGLNDDKLVSPFQHEQRVTASPLIHRQKLSIESPMVEPQKITGMIRQKSAQRLSCQDNDSEKYNRRRQSKETHQPEVVSEVYHKKYIAKKTEHIESMYPRKQETIPSQRSPTFKGLIQQMQNKYKIQENKYENKEMAKHKGNPSEDRAKRILKLINNVEINEEAKEVNRSRSKSGKKFDVKALPRPSYEQIEQRRNRVLKEYQQLNLTPSSAKKQSVASDDFPVKSNVKTRKQSTESSFGYIPLSIISKKQQREVTPSKKENYYHKEQRNVEKRQELPLPIQLSTPLKEVEPNKRVGTPELQNSFKKIINETSFDPKNEQRIKNLERNEDSKGTKTDQLSSQQNTVSPARPKKTYVYLFE